jgi:type I restriction enzyme S subunit
MKKYPKYKASGVEWIGEIPETWNIKKLKFIAQICNGQDQKAVLDDNGIYPVYGSGGIFGMANSFLYDKPSILLGRKGTIDKPQYVDKPFWSVDTSYYTKIRDGYAIRYFYYLCTTINFDLYKYGSAIPSMTQSHLNEIKFALPKTLEDQVKIATFLDYKTNEIETLISNKQKLIELLQEERTATINHAVTKGINPKAKLKPSGIEWLGDIPEHWEVKKLKYCFDIIGGFAFNSSDFKSEGIQLVKIGNLYQNQLQLDRQPTYLPVSFKDVYSNYLVKKNDILLSLTGTLGKRDYGFAILIAKDEELLINQRVAKITAKYNISIDFAISLFQSETYLNRLFCIPTGTKQGNLSGDDVLSISMGISSFDEQVEIAEFIKREQNRINTIITKAEQEIELLKEYKTALISEVVTGKVDVSTSSTEL